MLTDLFNAVIDFFDLVQNFFTSGIYSLLTEFTAWAIKWLIVFLWKAKLALLEFSYDVALDLMASLQISNYLNTFWSAIDGRIASMMQFFKIPEAINILLNAGFTRFVFKFIGF